jgi:hypothetical protein
MRGWLSPSGLHGGWRGSWVWRLGTTSGSALLREGSDRLPSMSTERARDHGATDLEVSVAMVVVQGRGKADLEDPSRM